MWPSKNRCEGLITQMLITEREGEIEQKLLVAEEVSVRIDRLEELKKDIRQGSDILDWPLIVIPLQMIAIVVELFAQVSGHLYRDNKDLEFS